MEVINWKEKSDLTQFRHIFFESSVKKDFNSISEKEHFFDKYTYVYLTHPDAVIFGAWAEDQLLGYTTLFPDSASCEHQYTVNKFYSLFEDLFSDFPVHLHINCRELARGKGVGSKLIDVACEYFENQGSAGIHLVTAPDARNVSFYQRNGFTHSVRRKCFDLEFLFLGRSLS